MRMFGYTPACDNESKALIAPASCRICHISVIQCELAHVLTGYFNIITAT